MKETDFNKFLDDLKQTESYGVEQKKKSYWSECTCDKAAAELGNFQEKCKLGLVQEQRQGLGYKTINYTYFQGKWPPR